MKKLIQVKPNFNKKLDESEIENQKDSSLKVFKRFVELIVMIITTIASILTIIDIW